MSDRAVLVPSYRRHKQSGQAIVTLPDGLGGRHDVLLGTFASANSRAEYARVIAEWEAADRRITSSIPRNSDVSVNELIVGFWRHAERHYRRADGTATNEISEYRYSLKPLKELFGRIRTKDFGPLALKAVRERMIKTGWCRSLINQRVGRVKRVFKWGVAEELVPATIYQALQAVAGIPRGRGLVRETEPVGPVPEAFVEAIRPFVLPPVWAMIQLQRLTGMRPGEVCAMRAVDIDMTGPVWTYKPPQQKTAWRGKKRIIALGPTAQLIVREFLTMNVEDFIFSPQRAMAERAVQLRATRVTRVQPSQQNRRKSQPRKHPGEAYVTASYAAAIKVACKRANAAARRDAGNRAKALGQPPPDDDQIFVPHWSPNRLRHSYATQVRRQYGLEAAGAALGHSKMSATEVYAERDQSLAERVAREIG